MKRVFLVLILGAAVLTMGYSAKASTGAGTDDVEQQDLAAKENTKGVKKGTLDRKGGKKERQSPSERAASNGKANEKSPAKEASAAKRGNDTSDAKEDKAGKDDKKRVAAKSAAKDVSKPDADKGKPATYKVKKRLLKVEVNLDGIFEARATAEIAMHGKEWGDFEVLKAVEHGTTVKAGDFLLALDTEKIDRVISDLQREQALSKIALQEAELQVKLLQSTVPLDLAYGDRTRRLSEEDYTQFLKVDRPLTERVVNFMVKMSEDYLAYEKEELRQLEKMYKADDLVEETEEIILKRARDSVARATFNVERMKTERETILKLGLPRTEETLKLNRQRQEIDWKRGQATIPNAQRRAELALEKLKIERSRSEERLQKLMADRTQMTVKAPVAGVVYYGRCVRGKWTNVDNAIDRLRRGGRVTNDDVFMTIVQPRSLVVRTMVSERQLQNVKPGMKGFVVPTGFPDVRLTAIVDRINAAPLGSQGFDAVVNVAMDELSAPVVAGMSCELHVVPYRKADALTIPMTALGSDDDDPRKFLIAVPGKDGKHEKRPVTIGKRADKQIEIVKGVAEGDEILAEYPKE
jgi:hypothetical protein